MSKLRIIIFVIAAGVVLIPGMDRSAHAEEVSVREFYESSSSKDNDRRAPARNSPSSLPTTKFLKPGSAVGEAQGVNSLGTDPSRPDKKSRSFSSGSFFKSKPVFKDSSGNAPSGTAPGNAKTGSSIFDSDDTIDESSDR